jgi:uncharacterized protein YggE
MENMNIIRVTGKGQLRLRPDMTRITLTLTGIEREYGDTLRVSSEKTDVLKELFAGFGFERSDLKTLNFNVDTEYESYQEDNVWKQRFTGYRFNHILKVEFGSDNDRLGKILYALANSDVDPQFNISYTVKDTEAAKNKLLGKAVKDAQAKAGVLAGAAGKTLGDILSIDYSRGETVFESRPVNRLMAAKAMGAAEDSCSYDMNIEPDDIDVSDTVTIVWEIR